MGTVRTNEFRKDAMRSALKKGHLCLRAPNLLARDFAADRRNQKWACNISYIWTREGGLYLAVILSLYSRASLVGPSATA